MEQGLWDEPSSDLSSVSSEQEHYSRSVSTQESQSRAGSRNIEVYMEGIEVGKEVELRSLDSYEELLRKLEEMFEIEGQLCGSTKKWLVVYMDVEDDMMMIGDYPWQEFCSLVRKIFICSREGAKKLSSAKLPFNYAASCSGNQPKDAKSV